MKLELLATCGREESMIFGRNLCGTKARMAASRTITALHLINQLLVWFVLINLGIIN